ncbi:MAG: inorganic diphosphatase [Flavobacteriaceae bacterium]|nr:inorganic diphosphatase [Flavobacteriaceae bacterium]
MKINRRVLKIEKSILAGLLILIVICSCKNESNNSKIVSSSKIEILNDTVYSNKKSSNLLTDYTAINEDGDINAVIEITSGTREKWEVDKLDGTIKLELIDSLPRIINYLGYLCNYGMIPGTLLPKELGGDGNPLDVMVLGDPIERGTIVKCKLIGVLYLMDRGEKDDKLIAVKQGTSFYNFDDLEVLDDNYNGILEILQLWFTNYKGPNKMISNGYGDKETAMKILNSAVKAYKN